MEEKLLKYISRNFFLSKFKTYLGHNRNDGFVDDDDGNTFGNSFRFHKIQTSGHGIGKSIPAINK